MVPITIVPQKVDGHIDWLSWKTLLETLNIELDLKEKSFCKYIQASNLPSPSLFDDLNWGITVNGVPITEDIEEVLTDHIHTQALF